MDNGNTIPSRLVRFVSPPPRLKFVYRPPCATPVQSMVSMVESGEREKEGYSVGGSECTQIPVQKKSRRALSIVFQLITVTIITVTLLLHDATLTRPNFWWVLNRTASVSVY